MCGLEHFHNEITLYCYKAREIFAGVLCPPSSGNLKRNMF